MKACHVKDLETEGPGVHEINFSQSAIRLLLKANLCSEKVCHHREERDTMNRTNGDNGAHFRTA